MTRTLLRVTGTVQGVGFRPFVYRHAVALGLAGSVRNDSAGVLIDVEGEPERIAELHARRSPKNLRRSRASRRSRGSTRCRGGERDGFSIVESDASGAPSVPVSVDTATCDDCLAEIDDPADRRYRYPFTNCTNCGPRYTIVRRRSLRPPGHDHARLRDVPRLPRRVRRSVRPPLPRATQRVPAMRAAAHVARPRRRARSPTATTRSPPRSTRSAAGAVVAVKGIGGYHLAVDATNTAAVRELRRRKARDDKPFAVMVPDLAVAGSLCVLDGDAIACAPVAAAGPSCSRPAVRRPRSPSPMRSRPGCPTSACSSPTRRSTTCSWRASAARS